MIKRANDITEVWRLKVYQQFYDLVLIFIIPSQRWVSNAANISKSGQPQRRRDRYRKLCKYLGIICIIKSVGDGNIIGASACCTSPRFLQFSSGKAANHVNPGKWPEVLSTLVLWKTTPKISGYRYLHSDMLGLLTLMAFSHVEVIFIWWYDYLHPK